MSSQKQKREPLLYIHQPVFQEPTVKMQNSFSSKQAVKRKKTLETILEPKQNAKPIEVEANDKGTKDKKKKKVSDQDFVISDTIFPNAEKDGFQYSAEEVQDTLQKYEEEEAPVTEESNKDDSYSFKRVKSFREMNTMERIDYLINFPKQLPPVPCMLTTKDKTYRGFVLGKTDHEIEVKFMDKSTGTLLINSIVEVRMIGL